MECLLCSIWERMPYAAKYTTPTSAQETEGALIVGYWTASRATTVPRLCQRHMFILSMLDEQEQANEQEVAQPVQPAPIQPLQLAPPVPPPAPQIVQPTPVQYRQRKGARQIVPPILPITAPAPKPIEPSEFKLGPGPLTNENSTTEQPPLPMTNDLAAPYKAKPGTPEGAIEAASMPPQEGAKVSYPCPSCGKEVTTGDIHACKG